MRGAMTFTLKRGKQNRSISVGGDQVLLVVWPWDLTLVGTGERSSQGNEWAKKTSPPKEKNKGQKAKWGGGWKKRTLWRTTG